MKKYSLFLIFTLLVALSLPMAAQTDLYGSYAHRQDLSVACILDYKLAEGRTIDVAMIQAKDSNAWQRLAVEFGLETLPQQLAQTVSDGGVVLQTRYVSKTAPQKTASMIDGSVDYENSCFMGVSWNEQTIWVFYYRDREQLDFLKDHLALNDEAGCGTGGLGSTYFCFNGDNKDENGWWNLFCGARR